MRKIIVNENDSGQRLNKFIEKTFPKFPKSAIYKAIRTKKIKINGNRCEAKLILQPGDVCEIYGFSEFIQDMKSAVKFQLNYNFNLDIVYEDENLIIVNKPAGLVSHFSKLGQDSLISRIINYLKQSGGYEEKNENSFIPALCNRIDTNTQGLVMAAKNAKTLRCVNKLIKEDDIIKIYFCLAEGFFKKNNDILVGWLKKNSNKNKVIISKLKIEDAKKVITQYFVEKQFIDYAKLRVVLHTGRSHQIRAHMALIGHPIVGDFKYGSRVKTTMKLCASGLIFKTQNTMLGYLNGKKIEIKPDF